MVRIAVIGAGASGIVATKTCLEYGYDVICYEKSSDLGGLWRYKSEGEVSVMRSTILNTSKEMSAFSDFPPPPEFSNFMHHRQLLQYFRLYAEHFDILPFLKYLNEVQLVKRADDFDRTGRWVVNVKDLKSGTSSTESFDGVILCTGHHVFPYIPEIPGMRENFAGQVLHSHSYKEPSQFEDKNVLVVGIGNSGVDISVEVSRLAKQVYFVARRGAWIRNRVYTPGVPEDMVMNSHWLDPFLRRVPNVVQAVLERKLMRDVDLKAYGLYPTHRLFAQQVTVADELPYRIDVGAVLVKPNVTSFTGPNSCAFEDGTYAYDIDAVIMCTGYHYFVFPYLEDGVIPVHNNSANLYKHMYPPDITHPETLAVIGVIQPAGAIFPIMEMQCRIFCEYIQGRRSLPSREKMHEDIMEKRDDMARRYVHSPRYTIQTSYVPFINELAEMIDVKPPSPFTYLLKGDRQLAWALAFGPSLSYEFRLRGPHQWHGAREAIVDVWDRVIGAANNRPPPAYKNRRRTSLVLDSAVTEYSQFIIGLFAFLAMALAAMLAAF